MMGMIYLPHRLPGKRMAMAIPVVILQMKDMMVEERRRMHILEREVLCEGG